MAQGFNKKAPKAPADLAKRKSSTSQKAKDPKKGARTIPPKKAVAVSRAIIQKKNTSSHSSSMERTIATAAISRGKLTIMRPMADETDEGRKAAKRKNT